MAVSKISAKEFKKLYNNFEGTDTEFAEFLNKNLKLILIEMLFMREEKD